MKVVQTQICPSGLGALNMGEAYGLSLFSMVSACLILATSLRMVATAGQAAGEVPLVEFFREGLDPVLGAGPQDVEFINGEAATTFKDQGTQLR